MDQVRIELDADERVQLATRNLSRAIVQSLRVFNQTDTPLTDLRIKLSVDPEIAAARDIRVDLLPPRGAVEVPAAQLDLPLKGERLANQIEREPGHLQVCVARGDEVLAAHTAPIEILAYNEWIGLGSPPEMLAAFVTPNHPAIGQVLDAARTTLRAQGVDESLEGYQSRDPGRVATLARAVYQAIGALGIGYANPPASFEKTGQKIRMADQVLSERLGTCLDLSVLMAAAMEQIGLHPLVLLEQGHAFVGVWLTEWSLPTPWIDDPSAVRKRIDLGECLAFDSSPAASGGSFQQAVEVAGQKLQRAETFRFALDVRSARQAGIRPIGVLREGRYVAVDAPARPAAEAEALPAIPRHAPLDGPQTPAGRIERWKTKLLDLSLRNRLLNHRDTKLTLPLLGSAAARVEDALEAHGRLTLLPRHAPVAESDGDAVALGALDGKRLIVDLPAGEFDKRVVELYRRNRQMLDDSGASALFLSLGMLRWYESPSSEQERLAPILLVPVTLERTAVGGPYHLVRSEEDTIVNSTLLKKLEADFGVRVPGLGAQLAMDEHGVDVDRNLNAVLEAVKDLPRFDVLRQTGIAFYEFQKFMMWLDLEQNAQALMSSDIVRHIIEGSDEPFPVATALPNPDEVDARPAAEDLSLVDADSSQVAAVFSALEGNSFVLQGPPGTGKSQTITNLIAQALGRGKSVLFVSEKRAALEVVEHRLKMVGLGPFTLEVHSDRASKSEVVRQLEEPLKFAWSKPGAEWARTAEELQALRARLNGHVAKMHAPGPFGESLYQAVSRLIELEARGATRVSLTFPQVPDREAYLAMRDTVSRLAVRAEVIGPPSRHPWQLCGADDWSTAWQHAVREAIDDAAAAGEAWQQAHDAAVGLVAGNATSAPGVFELLGQAAELLARAPEVPAALLSEPRAAIEASLRDVEERLRARAQALTTVTTVFDPRVLTEVDIARERTRFAAWARAFFLFAFVMLFFARRRLRAFARDRLGSNEEVLATLEAASTVAAEDAELARGEGELRRRFGAAWRGSDTSGEELDAVWAWASSFREVLAAVREHDPAAAEKLVALATDSDARGPRTQTGAALEELQRRLGPWQTRQANLERLLDLGPPWAELGGGARLRAVTIWRGHPDALRDWCDWLRAARAVEATGLGALVDELRADRLSSAQLLPAFERAVRERWWEARCADDRELRQFRGADHESVIARFRQLDEAAKRAAREEIQARVAARLPDPNAPGEMEVLRREFSKQRRHKPVRKLFAEVPNALLRLKPCVLMSPLSVARFLDPSLSLFDIVVFDEASQIPPWDAIGAISRGKQAIVVGDSRQLPPTAFFTRDDGDDEIDDEDAVELESILEQAVVRGVPQMTLNWHYRSRHESLIAFSNHHYYDNRLHVFPSPHHQSEHLGLKWIEVPEGHYDRGGTRSNRAEARRVADEVVRRLEHPELSRKSLGVVTFSQAQQKEVEDLLDAARRARPHLERFFAHVDEPVFVKNLENVQGDERDVMLFSVGYGPDQTGRVTMGFGPLNRTGGERRLNVAVTRARELLLVYSTLRPDQIDLARTNALGVKHLKGFLDYAARGEQALLESVTLDPQRGFDSPFEAQVHDVLTSNGWIVHRQVGVGGFFIDLAVVDPDRPGAYLLGIECDGAAYHSARAARDRDRIRQGILESLGWTLHRVWSTDWWTQRSREIARLEEALRRAQFDERAAAVVDAYASPDEVLPELKSEEERRATSIEWPDHAEAWSPPAPLEAREKTNFYLAGEGATIVAQIEALVDEHAPVSLNAVARLVATAYGFASVTNKLRMRVLELGQRSRCHVADEVFWRSGDQRSGWQGFRYAPDGQTRDIGDVPPIEVENATLWLTERAVSIDRETLVAEVLKVFGHRMGSIVRQPADAALQRLLDAGRLRELRGKISRAD